MALDRTELLRRMSEDRALALDMLFSAKHEDNTPAIHLKIVEAWRSVHERVLIEGFRGSAKTTKAQEFICVEACYANFPFGLLVGETWDKACEKLENIKFALKSNKMILAMFGSLLGKGAVDKVDSIVLTNGVRIDAYGKGQSPRGRLHHDARPTFAMLDDIENKLNGDVASKEAVDATVSWLYAEVIPALDPKRGRIRVNCTPEGIDCLPVRLRSDDSWKRLYFPVCLGEPEDPDAQPLWAERFPMGWIRKQKTLFEKQGLADDFDREYMLRARSNELADFDERDLQECPALPSDHLPLWAMYDPARTKDSRSDTYGRVVAAFHGTTIYIVLSGGMHWKPSDMINDLFEVNEQYRPIGMGVESDSLEDWMREPIRAEMVKRNTVLPLVDLRAPNDKSKHDFIRGALQPFSRARAIVLVGGRAAHPQLVEEMRRFPSKNDNVVNALAYIVKMRPGEPVYPEFSDTNVSPNAQPQRSGAVLLAFNQSNSEVTCVAVQQVGLAFYVLREWVEPGGPADAVRSIWMSAQGELGRHSLVAYSPADVFDEWTRLELNKHLRALNVQPTRGGYYQEGLRCLEDGIRTTIRGQRALLVAPQCRYVIGALMGGYAIPMKNGRLTEEPVESLHKTLVAGLECMLYQVMRGQGSAQQANYASVGGKQFMTTRPDIYAKQR